MSRTFFRFDQRMNSENMKININNIRNYTTQIDFKVTVVEKILILALMCKYNFYRIYVHF